MLQAGTADVELRLAAGVAARVSRRAAGVAAIVGYNTAGRSSRSRLWCCRQSSECQIRSTAGVAAEGLMV